MPAERPNIIILLLDTQRADRLGCYGYSRDTSPNIDEFTRNSFLFKNAVAPGQWTIPSQASMLCGEPPSTHMIVQSGDILDKEFRTMTEFLAGAGYDTVGFCNNPIVGVINNGFKRGFNSFYNYGGAIGSGISKKGSRQHHIQTIQRVLLKPIIKASDKIQDLFSRSNRLFQGALNPFWAPLWTKFAHFKGDTARSIKDSTYFIKQSLKKNSNRPVFIYINLMETHFPFSVPKEFVLKFAPYINEDRAALDFLKLFNTQPFNWITPPAEPFTELQSNVLNDMYDAEVAYQDHLLYEMLEAFNRPECCDNTMIIILSDHGEMLGEHQLMGHGFGVYQELVHAALSIRVPGQEKGSTIELPVSITELFHTILDAAGIDKYWTYHTGSITTGDRSLLNTPGYSKDEETPVVCEAYPPVFALNTIGNYKPEIMEKLNCNKIQRAIYIGDYKLIQVENDISMLFNIKEDPEEMNPLDNKKEAKKISELKKGLDSFVSRARSNSLNNIEKKKTFPGIPEDEEIKKRLKGLGYY